MKKLLFLILLFVPFVFAQAQDVSVYQGQYYEGGEFMVGTYDFSFKIYDAKEGGNLIYSNSKKLSTGKFGEWYVELEGVHSVCNDPDKSYFMEISIDGKNQGGGKRLTDLEFLRKGGEQVVNADTTFSALLNVTNESYFREIKVNNKKVCLEDGSDCPILNFSETDPLFVLENKSIWDGIGNIFLNLSNYVLKSELPVDTKLTDIEISAMGYLKNFFELDPVWNVERSNYYVKSEVDNLIPVIPSYIDTNTQLSELEVDSFVSNNGYLTSYFETDPVWNVEKIGYYTREEIDAFLSSKISVPISISSSGDGSWLLMNGGAISFNEDRLNSFVDFKISDSNFNFNLSNYVLKSELNYFSGDYNDLLNIPSMNSDSWNLEKSDYYTKNEVDNLVERDSSVIISSSEGGKFGGDLFYVYGINSFNIRKSWTDIGWDKIVREDGAYEFVEGDSGVVIKNDGWYDVSFECTADTSSNSRYHIDWRAVLNEDEIPGTRAASYHGQRPDGRNTGSISFVYEFNSGDELKFQGVSNDDKKVFTVSNGCRLKIIGFELEKEVENLNIGEVYYDVIKDELKYYDGIDWKVFSVVSEIVKTTEEVVEKKIISEIEGGVIDKEIIEEKIVEAEENISNIENEVLSENESSGSGSGTEQEIEVSAEIVNEEPKEVCEDVCEEECSTEEVCKKEDICEDECKTDKEGNEVCKEKCKQVDVCEDIEKCSEVCHEECGIPEELFDIRMDLEDTTIDLSSELVAVVTYESFGSIPTIVNLTFEIFDSSGSLVYTKRGDIVVTVEEVRRYDFSDLILESGNYEFVFTTLYNVDVKDEFRQNFILLGEKSFFGKVSDWFSRLF